MDPFKSGSGGMRDCLKKQSPKEGFNYRLKKQYKYLFLLILLSHTYELRAFR